MEMEEEEEQEAPAGVQGSAAESSGHLAGSAGTPVAAPAGRVLPPPLDSRAGADEHPTRLDR